MHTQPTVSIQFTKMLLTYCEELGLNVRDMTQSVDLDTSAFDDPEERIRYTIFNKLFCEAESRSGLRNFGMHLGKRAADYSGGHILISMMRSCANMEDALERLLRYHSLVSDAFSFSLERQGEHTVVTLLEDRLVPRLPSSQVEQVFSMLVLILVSLTDAQVKPSSVNFRHRRPPDTYMYENIFGDYLLFGKRHDQIWFVTKSLKLSLPMHDPGLLKTIEQLVDKRLKGLATVTTWTARAERQLIRSLTKGEPPSFDLLAKKLALSGKTLRRLLKSEGTTFKYVLDSVREELAKMLLDQAEMSLYEVALLLGYAEQSTFNHAFRRWTGMSPGDFKNSRSATENKR